MKIGGLGSARRHGSGIGTEALSGGAPAEIRTRKSALSSIRWS